MRRTVLRIIRFLHGAMVMTAVMSGVCLLLSIFGMTPESYFPFSLLVLVTYVATAFAEEKIKGIGLFLLISIASVIPTALLAPDIASKIVFVLISGIIIAIRIVGRVRDSGTLLDSPHMAVVILFAVFYLIGLLAGNSFVSTLNYYLAFAYVIFILIYTNFLNLEGYLNVNKDVENIPVRKIGRTNNLMLLGYLGLTVTLMLVMPLVGLDKAIIGLGKGILALIRRLAALRNGTPDDDIVVESEVEGGGEMSGGMPDFGGSETPLWLTALYHAMEVALLVVAGIVVVAGIAFAIYRLVKAFYRPIKENSDEQEFIDPEDDDREYAEPQGGFFQRVRDIIDPTPTAAVRRLYRRRIKKQKVDFSEALTPEEIESAVGLSDGPERQILHEVYEKARYSERGCSEADLQRMRKGAAG